MNRYIDEGVAELVPGVLFIDEVLFIIKELSPFHILYVHIAAICPYLFDFLNTIHRYICWIWSAFRT